MMTTLYGSKTDLATSLVFFVLVAAAIAASTLLRGSNGVGVASTSSPEAEQTY
jgi:hypothetical protein